MRCKRMLSFRSMATSARCANPSFVNETVLWFLRWTVGQLDNRAHLGLVRRDGWLWSLDQAKFSCNLNATHPVQSSCQK